MLPIAHRIDPVVITKITVGGARVQAGRFVKPSSVARDPLTPFDAGDDWIQNLSIHLFNRTTKTIVAVDVNLGFLDTGNAAQPPRGRVLNLGRLPDPASFDRTGRFRAQPPGRLPLDFGPGGTMVVALGDYIDGIRSTLALDMPPAAVAHLRIDVICSYFADGVRFGGGGYSEPDPQNPGKWRSKDRAYSPGFVDASWPGRPGWVDQE